MNYRDIRFQSGEGIGFITLNRPEKRNALSMNLMAEMIDLLKTIKKNPEVRVVSSGARVRYFLPAMTFPRCWKEVWFLTAWYSMPVRR